MLKNENSFFLLRKNFLIILIISLQIGFVIRPFMTLKSYFLFSDLLIPLIFLILVSTDKSFKNYLVDIIFSKNYFQYIIKLYSFCFAILICSSLVSYKNIGYISQWSLYSVLLKFILIPFYLFVFSYFMQKKYNYSVINMTVITFVFLNVTILCFYITFGEISGLIDGGSYSGTLLNSVSSSFFSLLILILFFSFEQNLNLPKYQFVFYLSIINLAILCTNSRIGIFCLIVLNLWYFAYCRNKALLVLSAIISIAFWLTYREYKSPELLSVIYDSDIYASSIVKFNNSKKLVLVDPSTEVRLSSFSDAINHFFQKPFFGNGLGYFFESFQYPPEKNLYVHNTALWIASEMGLFGLFFFVLFYINLLKPIFFAFKSNFRIFQIIVCCNFVFLTYSLVQEVFFERIYWIYTALLIGWYCKCEITKGNPDIHQRSE